MGTDARIRIENLCFSLYIARIMSSGCILFIAKPDLISPVLSGLREEGYELLMSESLDGALKLVKQKNPDLIFSQTALPGYRIQDLLESLEDPELTRKVIAVAEQGTAQEAQQIMEAGAKDYWLGPLVWEKVQAVLPDKAARQQQFATREPQGGESEIVGSHEAMRKVLALAKQVAPSKASVLISGESGTGKEMFARFLHRNSPRAQGPFIALNCAALPEHLLESELFGHEKGAFTGAVSRKTGKFELAHKGTILLDEISEMGLPLQAKLLRVLQEGEIDRVGGTETVKVDVRVLATTNRNIEEVVQRGEFRQDLFYRLNVIPLRLPSLRERRDDILVLARHFIRDFCVQYGLPDLTLDQEARDWLLNYDWPGNVRELQNLMERAVLLAGPQGTIRPRHFLMDESDLSQVLEHSQDAPQETAPDEVVPPEPQQQNTSGAGEDEIRPLYEVEKRMIMKSLERTGGNRTQASELLGISVRTLRNKLSEYKKQGVIVS